MSQFRVIFSRIFFILKWPFAFLVLLTCYVIFSHWFSLIKFLDPRNRHILFKDIILFVIFLIIYVKFLQRKMIFWEIFFHELAHTIFSVVTFNKVRQINVIDGEGGVVAFEGYQNWLIAIAPYIFPVPTFLLSILFYFSKYRFHSMFRYLIIFSFAMYIAQVYKDFISNWGKTSWLGIKDNAHTDLEKVGHLFAILVVPAMNLLWGIFLVFFLQEKSYFFLTVVKRYLLEYLSIF